MRRVLRIFPAYLAVFVPLLTVAAWTGLGAPTSVPVDLRLFLSNLLLLPRDNLTTYIPVGVWTLTHELMFYLQFLVAFVSWRAFFALLVAWAAVGLGCYFAGIEPDGFRMFTSLSTATSCSGRSEQLANACALSETSERGSKDFIAGEGL